MTNILNSIVEYKASIVETRKKIRPFSLVREQAAEQTHVRGIPYLEIWLKANGRFVGELLGKKFHDNSIRVFESEENLLEVSFLEKGSFLLNLVLDKISSLFLNFTKI